MRFATTALSVLAIGLISSTARADECKRVDAPIVTTFFITGCDSLFGLCTQGSIPNGPLKGTTRFSVTSLSPGPSADVLLYTGVLVITTRHGTVTIQDRGLLNMTTAQFFELDQIVSGTGKFLNATGLLTSQGLQTATGFSGRIAGEVCRGKHQHERDRDDDEDGEE